MRIQTNNPTKPNNLGNLIWTQNQIHDELQPQSADLLGVTKPAAQAPI